MENFIGKDGFIWWTGVVEDRHDPLNLGRCRVRIFGWHNENKMLMPTETLPWAHPKLPVNNSKTFTTPSEGDWVTGFFFDGKAAQFPVYDGVLPGIARGATDPQKGFSDPRTESQLRTSPAAPAKTVTETDGSGTVTNSQPAPRNPIDVGFPSTNKLALNDPIMAAPQIVQRAFSTVQKIIGPEAKTLGTEIAGAAQGAAQEIQKITPKLEKLVPKVNELASAIEPSFNSLGLGDGPPSASSLSSLLSGASGPMSSMVGSLGGPEAQAKFQKDLATAQKNMAASEASVKEQMAKAQKAAQDAAAKAKAAMEKTLPQLQEESKNIAGSISENLDNLSAGNLKTRTPVILSPATISSITASTASFESSLAAGVPDEKLIYSGTDYIAWDRTNAERLRRKLPGLAAIGYPRPPEDAPPPVPKANINAVAPAPLVPAFAPNPIPPQVPLEKVGSTRKKSLENSITLYENMVRTQTEELLAKLPKLKKYEEFVNFIEEEKVIFGKWDAAAADVRKGCNTDGYPSEADDVFLELNSYTKKYQKQLTTAVNARIAEVKASGGA